MSKSWQGDVDNALKSGPRLLGISSMTGFQIKKGLEISAYVRKRSNIPIVWGGIHPSILPEQTLEHPLVDAVVVGEGEELLIKAFNDFSRDWPRDKRANNQRVGQKRVYRNLSPINLDLLPEIDYGLFDVERYIYSQEYAGRIFDICTNRGCPYTCRFCYTGPMYYRKWRCRPVASVINELKFLVSRFNIDGINWRDDCFFFDKDRVRNIADRIIKERININWQTQARVNDILSFGDGFLELLKESGLRSCTLGVESGSQRILDMLDKKTKVKDVLAAVKILKKHNIRFTAHFMFGLITETWDDLDKTVSLIDKLREFSNCKGINGPHIFTPYPGTGLYKDLVRRGYKFPNRLQDWDSFDWCNYRAPWISERKWKFMRKVIKTFSYTIDDKIGLSGIS